VLYHYIFFIESKKQQTVTLERIGLLGRPLWLQKYYLAIPGIKCSEAHIFTISGNDPIFIYDLLKLILAL